MLSATASGSMTLGAKEASIFRTGSRDSRSIWIPMAANRIKEIQWSRLSITELNPFPRKYPSSVIKACAPPNQSPADSRCLGSARSTDSPLQIAMAKASMDTPTAIARSSPIPIISYLLKIIPVGKKKETYLPSTDKSRHLR